MIDTKELKTKKISNPYFDSKYRTPKRPGYCPKIPQYICLDKGCPHLAYINALAEDYLFLNKKYKKEGGQKNAKKSS